MVCCNLSTYCHACIRIFTWVSQVLRPFLVLYVCDVCGIKNQVLGMKKLYRQEIIYLANKQGISKSERHDCLVFVVSAVCIGRNRAIWPSSCEFSSCKTDKTKAALVYALFCVISLHLRHTRNREGICSSRTQKIGDRGAAIVPCPYFWSFDSEQLVQKLQLLHLVYDIHHKQDIDIVCIRTLLAIHAFWGQEYVVVQSLYLRELLFISGIEGEGRGTRGGKG